MLLQVALVKFGIHVINFLIPEFLLFLKYLSTFIFCVTVGNMTRHVRVMTQPDTQVKLAVGIHGDLDTVKEIFLHRMIPSQVK